MIKLTPTQSSWELELNTSKFYDFLSHDTVASLDHVVDSAMMTKLGIKPPSIHPVLSNVTVLNLTLQVVKQMYEEDSDRGLAVRRCLPRCGTSWECVDVLQKHQDWMSTDADVPWFNAVTVANNSTKHRRLVPQGIVYPRGAKRGSEEASGNAFLATTVSGTIGPNHSILRWTWSWMNPRDARSDCDAEIDTLIDEGILNTSMDDCDILAISDVWMDRITRVVDGGEKIEEVGAEISARTGIHKSRATRLSCWIIAHHPKCPQRISRHFQRSQVDVVDLLKRAVVGCAEIALACAKDRLSVEHGAHVDLLSSPVPSSFTFCMDSMPEEIRQMINVISGGQREEYENVAEYWKELHECDVSLAWPITDWLLSEVSGIDWSAANLMEQANRCGKLHEVRAKASGLCLDMWGLAYDASINARFVDHTSLRVNSPSAIALFNRCRGEYERRWNDDVWEHLEASHRELQRAMVASATLVSCGGRREDVRIAASTTMLHVVAALEIGFHRWTNRAMRRLRDREDSLDRCVRVALDDPSMKFTSFLTDKRGTGVLFTHEDGFQQFSHVWGAVMDCKSLFMKTRGLLNSSKHSMLIDVKVEVRMLEF